MYIIHVHELCKLLSILLSSADNTQIRPEGSLSSSSQNPGYMSDPSCRKPMTRNYPRNSLPSDIQRVSLNFFCKNVILGGIILSLPKCPLVTS